MTETLVAQLDFDDLLVFSAQPMVTNYARLYGVRVPLHLVYSRDPRVWGVDDPDIAIRRNHDFFRTDEFANLPPNPAALGALTILAERGWKLHVGTGRPDFLQEVTEAACDRYFPGLIQSVTCGTYTATSDSVGRSITKSEMARRNGASVHSDDHIPHAIDVAQAGLRSILCGNLPWNQTVVPLPRGVERVDDISQIPDLLLDRVPA